MKKMSKEFDEEGDLDHLKDLAGQVDSYRRQAEELGRMQVGRPLLECPSCGFHEDELADLSVVVCSPDHPGTDTGLRFEPLDDEGSVWACPGCGLPVQVPDHPSDS